MVSLSEANFKEIVRFRQTPGISISCHKRSFLGFRVYRYFHDGLVTGAMSRASGAPKGWIAFDSSRRLGPYDKSSYHQNHREQDNSYVHPEDEYSGVLDIQVECIKQRKGSWH